MSTVGASYVQLILEYAFHKCTRGNEKCTLLLFEFKIKVIVNKNSSDQTRV